MKSTVFHRTVHLPEEDLLASSVSCPFCDSTERISVLVLQELPEVTLLKCDHCHASSASRMPTAEALTRYYRSYYDDKEEKVTVDTPRKIASHIYKNTNIEKSITDLDELSMLDYGGGDGTISLEVAKLFKMAGVRKINIFLIDHDQSLQESMLDGIYISRPQNLFDVPDKTIDLVIASAVIEHIPDPKPVLDKLFSSMKVGANFYARTPYVLPLIKLFALFKIRFDFTYPAHVHDLGENFWSDAARGISSSGNYEVIRSTPSVVETSFRHHFLRTFAAYTLKIPGYLFKKSYGLVGGWEIMMRRLS